MHGWITLSMSFWEAAGQSVFDALYGTKFEPNSRMFELRWWHHVAPGHMFTELASEVGRRVLRGSPIEGIAWGHANLIRSMPSGAGRVNGSPSA